MLKKFFPLLLTFVTASLFAQNTATIKGTVTDSSKAGIEFISVTVLENQQYNTLSDKDGRYTLTVPAGKDMTLVFSAVNIEPYKLVQNLKAGEVKVIDPIVQEKQFVLPEAVVKENVNRTQASTVEMRTQDLAADVMGGDVTALVGAQGLGVTKTNELSSNYSVRGGNFDENLVYVNDFEVYRPYLVRSGQQEGMSFANPSMVNNIKFTSGGFQARYGDKMSSVMDITYKRPQTFAGSVSGSLLGFSGHLEGCTKDQKFAFVLGVRQRLSQYVLKSLETSGQYSPNFLDVQGFFNFNISSQWGIDVLSSYARNRFNFVPVDRETTFGTITDVKRLTIYFEGQEADRYQALLNGIALRFTPHENLNLKLLGAHYYNTEEERFDILGEYYLSQVEADLGKENFGETLYALGVGGLHDWARNSLTSQIGYVGHRGNWLKSGHNLQWGLDYKHEIINDQLSEWELLDSAGHSLPYNPSDGQVDLFHVLKTKFSLTSNRYSAFVQDNWRFGHKGKYNINLGIRFSYWDVNREPVFQPRFQFSVKPTEKHDLLLNIAGGLYYQPPFYREMRNLNGQVNTNLKSQKSAHAVVGLNYAFRAWKRDFNFTTEVYYKHLWDMVPYEYDNVLIRYYGENTSQGYATGIDLRLNGELAKDAESWISLGIMNTKENISNDQFTEYYDSSGRIIYNVQKNYDLVRDSALIDPGYIPRPTNQLLSMAMFFQDYIPRFPYIRVQISLVFATGLPFGPPDHNRYRDTFDIPSYKRLDIGFSGKLWDPKWAKKKTAFNQGIKNVWLSFECFNILDISNTVSYLWIRDINNNQFAVPNYLTGRRFNAKLVINFGKS